MIKDNARLHSKVNIRVARLGTWKMLTWILEDERIGLFSLVRFDSHGVIKNHKYILIKRYLQEPRYRLIHPVEPAWSLLRSTRMPARMAPS